MDVFDLVAKLTLDDSEYSNKLGQDKSKAAAFGDSIKKGFGTAAKVAGAAIVAASTAAVALTKQAIQSYAQYEQLVGGVETLFKTSADTVQQYAAIAYKTAGLSANEYMETVTSFSASLLQSLGGDTDKAAKYADMAVTDMSDNANKMGTDMSAIQNAYQGFAKQNYTMLDNLKLGYGGTKSEMERLVEHAESVDSSFKAQRDSAGKLTLSYADIVDAIHIVQTEMDITGTTAKEASTTIEGSVKAVKASWSNLLTGLADDTADIDSLIDNFVDSLTTAGDNLLPRIEKALNGITKLVTTGIQKLAPIVVKVITSNLPQIIKAGTTLLVSLITGIIQALPELVAAIPEILKAIWDALVENAPMLKEAGIQLMIMIAQGIATGLEWIGEKMMEIGSAIQGWLSEAWENVKAAAAEKWAQIGETISTAVETIRTKFAEWVEAAASKIEEFKEAIHTGIQGLLSSIGTWIEENLITPAREKIAEFVNIGSKIVENIKQGLTDGWSNITGFFKGKWTEILGGGNNDGTQEVQAQVDAISKIFMDGTETAGDAGTQTAGEYLGSIKDGVSDAESAGSDVSKATTEGMKKFVDAAYRAGVSVIEAYNRGVKSQAAATPSSSGFGSAIGMDFVPYNGFPAILHRGEAVLTSREADDWRRGNSGGGNTTIINQYIESQPQTPVELAAATSAYFEQARWAVA